MESLLIFIAIFVIDALIKRANAKKNAEQQAAYSVLKEMGVSRNL